MLKELYSKSESEHAEKYVKRPGDILISVSELKIGMFVSGLDREWLGTPFLIQGFYIRSVEDIQEVAKYCRQVYILGEGFFKIRERVDLESGALIGRKPQKYPLLNSIQQEHALVHELSAFARKATKKLLEDARSGLAFDKETVQTIVKGSVESVIRHPDALFWMTKLRGENEYTVEHSINVSFLSIVFGRRLGLKKNQLVNLGLSALLHDIGKMRIPENVLNKPGKLSDAERRTMRCHPNFGREYLDQRRDTYQGAIESAYSHHERADGQGYPRGIPSSQLHIFTRIISIVDAYDAITGDRVYAKGRPSVEALRILYDERGKQFDDEFVLAFIQTIGIYPPGCIVEMVNGSVGIVLDVASGPKHLPKILLVLDENKLPCAKKIIDLSQSVDSHLCRNYLIKMTLVDGCYGVYLKDYCDPNMLAKVPTLGGEI